MSGLSRHAAAISDAEYGETSPKFLATGFRVNREKKICGAILSVRTLFFSIGAILGAIGLFLPHNMATKRGQHQEGKKRGKKATPRYVAESFASLCCIDKGFRGICATLSGGNPPRYGSGALLVM